MLEAITAFLKLFADLFGFLKDKQLIDAGKAEEKSKTDEKVLKNVKKAKGAVSRLTPSERDKLRKRYPNAK